MIYIVYTQIPSHTGLDWTQLSTRWLVCFFALFLLGNGAACPENCYCYDNLNYLLCIGLNQIPFPENGMDLIIFDQCVFNSVLNLSNWHDLETVNLYTSIFPCQEIFLLPQLNFLLNCSLPTPKTTQSDPISNISTSTSLDHTSDRISSEMTSVRYETAHYIYTKLNMH